MKLILGNKNYSSWSLRPWIAMKALGIPFEDIVIPFGDPIGNPEFKAKVRQYSPVEKLPVLVDGDIHVWETLAIMEYLAEKFPAAGFWPKDARARTEARVLSSEMHAGFAVLRGACPMNLRRPVRTRVLSAEAQADVMRLDTMWRDCRARYGGPFLFGAFCAADAMYAPMATRIHTYKIEMGADSLGYVEAVMALPAFAEWKRAALEESWIVPEDEVDWPQVLTA
jgi:glutathione S-transferase